MQAYVVTGNRFMSLKEMLSQQVTMQIALEMAGNTHPKGATTEYELRTIL